MDKFKDMNNDKNRLFIKRSKICEVINLSVFLLTASILIFILFQTELNVILKFAVAPIVLVAVAFLCERIVSVGVNKLVYRLIKR